MLRDNKLKHSPEFWSFGLAGPIMFGDERELRERNSLLADRWRRGMALYGQLLDLPWWAWRRDLAVVKQLGILRGEYRECLERRLAELLSERAVTYTYPARIPSTRTPERRRVRPDEVPYAPTYSNYPDVEADDELRFRALSQRYTEPERTTTFIADLTGPESVHTKITTHTDYSGHGGDFGGAGASGSWDSGSSSSSCDTSSSSDSSGGGDGGGGLCD